MVSLKAIPVFFLLYFLSFSAFSQELVNVFTEQDGEKINIYYTITGAEDGQTFKISVSCATENRRFVLKSVSGDVGDSIVPGKNKKIVWDVLKDVDHLYEAEFFVMIEKVNQAAPPVVDQDAVVSPPVKETDKIKPKTKADFTGMKKFIIAFDASYGLFSDSKGYASGIDFAGKFARGGPYFSFDAYKYEHEHFREDNNNVGIKGFSLSGGISLKMFTNFYVLGAFGYSRCKVVSQVLSVGQQSYIGDQLSGFSFKLGAAYVINRLVLGLGSVLLLNSADYLGFSCLIGFTI